MAHGNQNPATPVQLDNLPEFISNEQLADLLGIAPWSVRCNVTRNPDALPRITKFGRLVRYARKDVLNFVSAAQQ